MKQVNWGIIGCGDVTELKSGPAFNLVQNSKLVAVMRRNAAKAADYALRHNVPRWYSNADDLINDNEVNAIYVATPPSSHAEFTIKALSAGKPVYVEKPMALNYTQAREMLKTSENYNIPLFVAYYRRALPTFVKVKELLNANAIGKVRMVKIQLFKSMLSSENKNEEMPWRVKPEISGGGHFVDLASHQLDQLVFWFWPVEQVKSLAINQTGRYKEEDAVGVNILLPNNVLCNGMWNFNLPEYLNSDCIEIIGDKGSINLSCFDFKPVVLMNKDGSESWDFPKPKHVQQGLIELVAGEILGLTKSPSNGISGARTNQVLDKILNEYYNQK